MFENIKDNPGMFGLSVAIFIAFFIGTNFLGQLVGFWLTATCWGVAVAGLAGYLIYKKVKNR